MAVLMELPRRKILYSNRITLIGDELHLGDHLLTGFDDISNYYVTNSRSVPGECDTLKINLIEFFGVGN